MSLKSSSGLTVPIREPNFKYQITDWPGDFACFWWDEMIIANKYRNVVNKVEVIGGKLYETFDFADTARQIPLNEETHTAYASWLINQAILGDKHERGKEEANTENGVQPHHDLRAGER